MNGSRCETIKTVVYEATENSIKQRSEPGKGEIINLFLLKPGRTGPDPFIKNFGNGSLMGFIHAEDFAKCHWEIAVKSKLQVSEKELVQSLRDLADAIEKKIFDSTLKSPFVALNSGLT